MIPSDAWKDVEKYMTAGGWLDFGKMVQDWAARAVSDLPVVEVVAAMWSLVQSKDNPLEKWGGLSFPVDRVCTTSPLDMMWLINADAKGTRVIGSRPDAQFGWPQKGMKN